MTERQAVSAVAVPFLDLRPSHEALMPGLLSEIGELIDSGAFTNGPQVEAFERAFAQFCGTRSCVGVASVLDALRLARRRKASVLKTKSSCLRTRSSLRSKP
jgi:dTDP-4-amino-4,6-dideoxygalactose transaminase